jgi:hypothetical protein
MYLKLRWARFFTLAGWNWTLAHQSTMADFIVTIPCSHSECNGSHVIAVRVCEKALESLTRKHSDLYAGRMYDEPSPALFGDGPKNTYWQMVHGAGGGDESVSNWTSTDANELWERAARE